MLDQLLLLLLATSWPPTASAMESFPLYNNCSSAAGVYTANSTYQSNLRSLGAALAIGAEATGFAKMSFGSTPDTVYGLVLCRGDVAGADCAVGLRNAFQDVTERACLYDVEATAYYDQYMLRFSGDDFLATLSNEPELSAWNANTVQGGAATGLLVDRILELMNACASYAANSSSRYSTGMVSVREQGVEVLYGLVQCTPDLTAVQCRSCIANITGHMPMWSITSLIISGPIGARILGVRCNARFEKDIFFKETNATIKLHMPKGGKTKMIVIIVLSFGSLLLLIFGFLLLVKQIRDSRLRRELRLWEKEIIRESDSGFLLYKFSDIKDATDNFSEKLGEGGFGPVFQGKLPDGQEIAVKRLAISSGQGLVEFKNEIRLIAKLQHINLVRLLGCCIEGIERILVYEYMPKKSLDSSIFGTNAKLNWYARHHIIEGIAQGLLYIHEQSHLCVVHRDLKPSNILLDSEMNPKISDFGIARICTSSMSQSNTTTVMGTIGYMAPEYFSQKVYSTKSDIFAFGILVLEIISGKVVFGSYQIHGRSYDLRRYAWQIWRDEKCEELIDPSLVEEHQNVEIIRCIQVALLCVQESADDRPTMREVNMMLKNRNMRLPMPAQPGYQDIAPITSSPSTDMSITLPR